MFSMGWLTKGRRPRQHSAIQLRASLTHAGSSNPPVILGLQLTARGAGIHHAPGFYQQYLTLLFGYRPMRHTSRHHVQFALAQHHRAIAQVDTELAAKYEKYFVGFLMAMPNELAF
jgi:hypothetical protein